MQTRRRGKQVKAIIKSNHIKDVSHRNMCFVIALIYSLEKYYLWKSFIKNFILSYLAIIYLLGATWHLFDNS